MMRYLGWIIASFLVLATAYLLTWPVPFDPVEWTPAPNPGMEGPFSPNETLAPVEHLIPGVGEGPEDVTRDNDGFFYTGLEDGRIVRFRADGDAGAQTFASTGGRPVGMQFDTRGNLIVADAFKGLLSVSPSGRVSVLTDSVDGERMLFVDDLDIAADGTIWFSDASQRFDLHDYILDSFEGRATGRLLSFDPEDGETQVHLDGLRFANGVALGPDEAYVLVNETFGTRIVRLWLKGPEAGTHEVFLELPALADNISFNGQGTFWVALPAPRIPQFDGLARRPFLRKVLFRVLNVAPSLLAPQPYGWIIGLDTDGRVLHNLQDPSGSYGSITSVNEFDGKLYLGSVTMNSVGRIAAP
jgi:sugar lactone lactonase YvrE